MATVIFDFDGTLADTFPLLVTITYGLSPHTKRLPPKRIAALRKLPLLTALRRLGLPAWRLPWQMALTRARSTPHMGEVQPFDGVLPMLASLQAAGHQLFILTSNYPRNVRQFLRRQKLESSFMAVASVHYATVWTKQRALRRLVRRYSLQSTDCYCVGNEVLDVLAAKRVGMQAVAVTWSGQDHVALVASSPDAIIDTPQALVKLLMAPRTARTGQPKVVDGAAAHA